MSAAVAMPEGGQFGRFAILLAERRLQVDGQPVSLGSRAFDLLAALVTRRDRVVPKDELIDVVWPGLVVEENNLQVQISALRKVLGAQAIATVPGRGYQFTVAPAPTAVAPHETKQARVHGAADASASASAIASAPSRRSRLLVADDNKVNRLLLCRSLELMGHDVASADNGRQALDKLRGEPFDMLLLDLEMPELDGFALLERRAEDAALREVPVIVTSSLEGAAHVARCIELGADDYLHKPVNPVLLKARVASSLERKHLRDRERELLSRLAPERRALPPATDGAADGLRADATVLMAGLRDVDESVPTPPPRETLELLSSWTTLMLDAIEGRGGVVTGITGDGIAAVFGAPEAARCDGGAPWAAVQAAQEMMELAAQFNAERAASGKGVAVLGIGIASGEVVVGPAGTPRRSAYVCVGAAAQRATRLLALTSHATGPVLMDDATHGRLDDRAVAESVLPDAFPEDGKTGAAYALRVVR